MALADSIGPVFPAASTAFFAVSSAIFWWRKPIGLPASTRLPSWYSIFSITPSRRAETSDFSYQSIVPPTISESPDWAGFAADRVVFGPWPKAATERAARAPQERASTFFESVIVGYSGGIGSRRTRRDGGFVANGNG